MLGAAFFGAEVEGIGAGDDVLAPPPAPAPSPPAPLLPGLRKSSPDDAPKFCSKRTHSIVREHIV